MKDVGGAGVADALEALLRGARELAAYVTQRVDAERRLREAAAAGAGGAPREERVEHVVGVGERRHVRQVDGARQPAAGVRDVRRGEHVERRPVVHAAQRHLDVRVVVGVVLADADDARHVARRDHRHHRLLLHRQEVAEAARAEAVLVVDAERLALLHLDVLLRAAREAADAHHAERAQVA